MKKIVFPFLLAALLWFLMFSPLTRNLFNFWIAMTISACLLICCSLSLKRNILSQFTLSAKSLLLGAAMAIILYFLFCLGNYFSNLLFDFAKPQIADIYALKNGQNKLLIAAALLFIIGPAEELFWRAFVQQTCIEKFGEWPAMLATTCIYSLVHIWSCNLMLVSAALVCGIFWGMMYRFNKNLTPLVVSHALWDVLAFIIIPIQS